MTGAVSVQQHPASVDAYIRHGWSLVPIPQGTKGPRTKGWNLKQNALTGQGDLPHGFGIGLAHAYSGTMALDIDNWSVASGLLIAHGVDLDALYNAPDAVTINSGKPGHGKLLYAMPFGAALPSRKISGSGVTAYELRCATVGSLTVQDVLPPSIHPETNQPYHWGGRGHWTRLPPIPQPLLDLWCEMLDDERVISADTAIMLDASWDEIAQAIESIPADCSRDEWVSVGMALHWAGHQTAQVEQAFKLWDDWSATSQAKYPGARGITSQWSSFKFDKTSSVRLGTLFHIAKDHGWHRTMPTAEALFSRVDVPAPTEPASLLDGLRQKPPEMMVELWPAVLRVRAVEVGDTVGCDPVVPLFAGLAAVCGVIDARMRLQLMPGFEVPPVLWLMTLGDPADKKSPGSRPMLEPLKAIEAEDRPRYGKALLEWEGKEAAYASAKKAFLEWSASTEALLGTTQAPAVPEMPPQPVPLKITVSDITSQKMVRQAADRPRGLLCYLDEMASWVRKLTDRASGEDRSAWVAGYESARYEMDRVGAGSIHAENMAVSIYGNIQPQVFKASVQALSADGLLQRFVPAVLHGTKTRLGNPIPDYMTSASEWERTLRMVYALPPRTYHLSAQAYTVFRDFQVWYEAAKQDERVLNGGIEYMTAFGKLEGLAGRLMLVWHAIEDPFSAQVSEDMVHRVVSFIRGYVIPAYRYVLGEIGGILTDGFDQWMIEYVIQVSGDMQSLDLRALKRSARRPLEGKTDWQKDQAILDAMITLEQAGWVAQTLNELHKKQVIWAINPALPQMFKDYRALVVKARQRHADYIYRHAYAKGSTRKHVKGYIPDLDDPSEK